MSGTGDLDDGENESYDKTYILQQNNDPHGSICHTVHRSTLH